jgi:hypothetical protein
MSEEREQKNQSVFTPPPPPGVDPRIQQVSAASQIKSDFGIEIPVETVPLPSGGRVYPSSSPLHGHDTLEIRSMTAREEDILTSAALMKKGTIISELLRSCLVDKSIDPQAMTTGDRNALMVAVRITGYGPDYDVEVNCNECGTKTPRTFNLAELPIQRLKINPVAEGLNQFEFLLPHTKKKVMFRFMTGHDEQEISSTSDKAKKLGLGGETNVTSNLLHSIISVDGVEDRAKIAQFVRSMPARDSLALRSYIRDNEPGILMRQEVECPTCKTTEEVGMPIGVSFLWPSLER